MSMTELEIEHKTLPATLVATTRLNAKNRAELRAALTNLAGRLPTGSIAGPAFCLFQFITSYTEGFDVEVGFPLAGPVEADDVQTRTRPAMQVLARVHHGPVESLRDDLLALYGFASEHGVISDEFRQEVYLDADDPQGSHIELHFVIHDWNRLLDRNLARVLGEEPRQTVMAGSEAIALESSIPERFQWTRAMMDQLDALADDDQRYEILSRCAHVFPVNQIAKLGVVFEHTRAQTGDPWQAVDAVIEFMIADPGWGVRPCGVARPSMPPKTHAIPRPTPKPRPTPSASAQPASAP